MCDKVVKRLRKTPSVCRDTIERETHPGSPLAHYIPETIHMKKINNSDPFARKLSHLATISIVVATSIFSVQAVQAADWRFDPIVRVGYEFDDNAPLAASPDSNDEIQGYIIEGSATIGSATQRTTFDITPKITCKNIFT